MSELPDDLVPLPTAPYSERPIELPLDVEECRTALWLTRGNVTKAAALIKVPSGRLRKFIASSAYLSAEQKESQEQLLDRAEEIAAEALEDVDTSRKDAMARFIMTNLGKDRGYGTPNGKGGVGINLPTKGRMVIAWDDGSEITGPEKAIEHAG